MKALSLGLVLLLVLMAGSAGAGAIAANPGARTAAQAPAIVTVPSVTGVSSTDAKNIIVRAGLSYQMAGFVQAGKADQDGKVASQNPAAGAKVAAKSVISCKVYRAAQKMAADEARVKTLPRILK